MNKTDALMTAAYNMGCQQAHNLDFDLVMRRFDAYCDHMNVSDRLYQQMVQKFEEGYNNG